MERWQFIGWGIAASVLAHILFALTIFVSTNVRTYDQAAPDPIPVDVVSEEPAKAPEPAAECFANPRHAKCVFWRFFADFFWRFSFPRRRRTGSPMV